eukprot:SAG11_NODE_3446_length_2443_cov_1.235922_5_plen_176_part_00
MVVKSKSRPERTYPFSPATASIFAAGIYAKDHQRLPNRTFVGTESFAEASYTMWEQVEPGFPVLFDTFHFSGTLSQADSLSKAEHMVYMGETGVRFGACILSLVTSYGLRLTTSVTTMWAPKCDPMPAARGYTHCEELAHPCLISCARVQHLQVQCRHNAERCCLFTLRTATLTT